MRYIIFSDIHNHTTALQQILADAQRHSPDAFYCLGDVGTDASVEVVRSANIPTVFGNWEVSNWRYLSPDNQQWALALPPLLQFSEMWLAHAAPVWPPKVKSLTDLLANPQVRRNGKLFPYLDFEEDYLWQSIGLLFDAGVPLLFHGHTHRQLAWRFTRTNKLLREYKAVFQLAENETYVVGVGSVGHPQDGPGASYVVYNSDTRTVEFCRVV